MYSNNIKLPNSVRSAIEGYNGDYDSTTKGFDKFVIFNDSVTAQSIHTARGLGRDHTNEDLDQFSIDTTTDIRSNIAFKDVFDDFEEMTKTEVDAKRKEHLLSLLKKALMTTDTARVTTTEGIELDTELDDYTTTTGSPKVESTTPYMSEEVKELIEINELFKEENSMQIAVMYLLKTPDPLFNPPACSDECTLNLKLHHISWHSNAIFELVRFILFSTKLPNSAHLMGETVFKGRVVLFCIPGFFLKGNFCVPCLPGSYNFAGFYSKCELCPFDTYQEEYGSKECIHCPSGTKTKPQLGSYKMSACHAVRDTSTQWAGALLVVVKSFFVCLAILLGVCLLYVLWKNLLSSDQASEGMWKQVETMVTRQALGLDLTQDNSNKKRRGLRPKRSASRPRITFT